MQDAVCAWCAKDFEQNRSFQIYCCKACCVAAQYEEFNGWRKHARAALVCVDCRAPIVGAQKRHKKLCPACKRKHRLANCRSNRERTKAGTNGRRGRNQFTG